MCLQERWQILKTCDVIAGIPGTRDRIEISAGAGQGVDCLGGLGSQ